MSTKKNLYETLGIKSDATDAEIKRAYRKKADKVHPDHGGSHEAFSEVSHAYMVLKSPAKRLLYDSTGEDTQIPKESRVQATLMQAFMEALQNDAQSILDFAYEYIDKQHAEKLAQQLDWAKALDKLRFKRNQIKVEKGCPNAFKMLADKQIVFIEQNIAGMQIDIEMYEDAFKELEKYSEPRF